MFPNAGAYTVAGACDFNGIEFTTPNKFYVFSERAAADLEKSDFDSSSDEDDLNTDDDDEVDNLDNTDMHAGAQAATGALVADAASTAEMR